MDQGQDLINKIASSTGLPQEYAKKRLEKLITQHGSSINDITLEKLRPILAEFLQDTLLELSSNKEAI